MYKRTLAKFPNGIQRKITYNDKTKKARWVLHLNGIQRYIPGKFLTGNRFKFSSVADEQLFLSTYSKKRESYDNYEQTPQEKLLEGRKRWYKKISAFRKENSDKVLCSDGKHRRIYYITLTKTSGYVTISKDGKSKNIYGKVHNSIFTHNQRYNEYFQNDRLQA